MRTRRSGLTFLLIFILLALGCSKNRKAPAEKADKSATDFTLSNGLRVMLRPVKGANRIAIVALFSIGEDHDPEGKSGFGHLIEHLYVTAAAGSTPARDMNALGEKYGMEWNAQTGSDYTVVAVVVSPDRLEEELADAASRLGDLRVEEVELDRERVRLIEELRNMYERIPALAAMNRARAKVRPAPLDGRKGGIAEHVASITLDEIRERATRYYKPRNVLVVIAGGFDQDHVKDLVERLFGGIAGGDKIYPPAETPVPRAGAPDIARVRPLQPGMPAMVAVSFRSPRPQESDYPGFLLLIQRMQLASSKLSSLQDFFPVNFAPLDDPDVITISLPLGADKDPGSAIQDIYDFVAEAVARPLQKSEVSGLKNSYAFLLGLASVPDAALAGNLYGLAFSMGRRSQLGLDSETLLRALDSLQPEDLMRSGIKIFSPARSGAAAIIPE